MKPFALGSLGLLLGCNQIFGLKQTAPIDAAVDAPPPVPAKTYLMWGIPQLDPISGQPAPTAMYAGIGIEADYPEQPTIRVGPELDARGDAALMDAAYDPSPDPAMPPITRTPGGFDVPDELLGQHWRMVYTLPRDPVPHEVQWTVSTAYLVIPRMTRLHAPAVPPNSGYSITPVNGPMPIAPVIMTSGVWTWSPDLLWTNTTFRFDYSHDALPLTGPAGAPETAKGDWVLVSDWQSIDMYESSVAGWALTHIDLVANIQSEAMPEPTWVTRGTPDHVTVDTDALGGCNRLAMAVIDFPSSATCAPGTSRLGYGLLPAPSLPGFGPDGAPLYLPLDIVTKLRTPLTLIDVDATVPLPHALYSKLTSTRQAAGVTLESSIEVLASDLASPLDYPAALVTDASLTDDAGTFSLALSNDNVMLDTSASPLILQYTYEPGTVATADELTITLYDVTGGTLAPVRTYTLPDAAASVRIDHAVLAAGHRYTFAFVTHHGYRATATGDYRQVSYPFGQSTKFSGVFTAVR